MRVFLRKKCPDQKLVGWVELCYTHRSFFGGFTVASSVTSCSKALPTLLNHIGIQILVWGLGLFLLFLSNNTFAEFSIERAQTRLEDNVYLLNAKLNYGLTEVTLDALQNGVPLTLVLTIKLEQNRRFLWDKEIATLKQRYELRYHALRRQYVIKYLNTGIEEFFMSINETLDRLGNLSDFPLIDKHLIKYHDSNYWVYMQIYLDIESLPVPLRPIAYLSSQWRLSSSWSLCPLKP
jgi:hypothetical protein